MYVSFEQPIAGVTVKFVLAGSFSTALPAAVLLSVTVHDGAAAREASTLTVKFVTPPLPTPGTVRPTLLIAIAFVSIAAPVPATVAIVDALILNA